MECAAFEHAVTYSPELFAVLGERRALERKPAVVLGVGPVAAQADDDAADGIVDDLVFILHGQEDGRICGGDGKSKGARGARGSPARVGSVPRGRCAS